MPYSAEKSLSYTLIVYLTAMTASLRLTVYAVSAYCHSNVKFAANIFSDPESCIKSIGPRLY